MTIGISDIVQSLNGRDAGNLFFVTAVEDGFAFIADGKGRRLERPKRKKLKHIRYISGSNGRVALKLRTGEKTTNNELRRALAEFHAGRGGETGGM